MNPIEGRCRTCRHRDASPDMTAGLAPCILLSAGPPPDDESFPDAAYAEDWARIFVGPEFGCVHWEIRPTADAGEVTP